jgi:alkylation response protein AidB-like acyl-CoA dehydrogenase
MSPVRSSSAPARRAWPSSGTTTPPSAGVDRRVRRDGLVRLPLGEDVGGGGGTAIELAILGEELGRASLDVAQCFVLTLMAGWSSRGSAPRRCERLFPAIVAGEQRLSIGMSISTPAPMSLLRTTAAADGSTLSSTARRCGAPGGLLNTQILAYVRTDPSAESKHDGLSASSSTLAPGVVLRRIPTLARHILGTYEVFFDDVRARTQLVGPLDQGWRVMLSGIDLERVSRVRRRRPGTLDEAVEHGSQTPVRRPVGVPGRHPPLADMQTRSTAPACCSAAWMHSTGHRGARRRWPS